MIAQITSANGVDFMGYRSYYEIGELIELLKNIANYKKYESFSNTPNHPNGHVKYDDLMARSAKTASGLLYDAVATTARLSLEERRKHKYAQEVFAAFCLHYCVVALSNPVRYCFVGTDIAMEVSEKVFRYIMGFLKRKIDAGVPIVNLRRLLIHLAHKKSFDSLIKAYLKDPESGKWSPKIDLAPIEEMDDEKREYVVSTVVKHIMQKAREQMRKEDLIADLGAAIDECYGKKILTREDVIIICHSFGLGEGYEHLTQSEIAKKLGRSETDSCYVSRHLKSALEKLRIFILQTEDYKHLARAVKNVNK